MDNLTGETLRLAAERIRLIDELIAHFQAERERLLAATERLEILAQRVQELHAEAAEVTRTI